MPRLDEPRHIRFVAEGRPQPPNSGVQTVLVVHKRTVGPETSPKLVTSDHISGSFEQCGQHAQWLFLEGQADTGLSEFARPQVHLERTKSHDACLGIHGNDLNFLETYTSIRLFALATSGPGFPTCAQLRP
jgi:hypothetical protein